MDYLKRVATDRGDVTLFFESRCPLSNFNKAPFVVNHIKFISTEQYLHFRKAQLFNDEEAKLAILACQTPFKTKQLGRSVKNFDEAIWNGVCYTIMKEGCLAKFSQNEHHRAVLFKTKGSALAEASPFDAKWGIGLGIEDPHVADAAHWPGKNLLGRILTEVRDELMAKQEDEERELTELRAYFYTKFHRIFQHTSLGDGDEAKIIAFVDVTEADMFSSGVLSSPFPVRNEKAHELANRRTHYYGVFNRIVENTYKGDSFEGKIKAFLEETEAELINKGVISKPQARQSVEEAVPYVWNILRSDSMESRKLRMLHDLFYPREMYEEPIKFVKINAFLGDRWRATLEPPEVIRRFLLENGHEVKFVVEGKDRDQADAGATMLFFNALNSAVKSLI